MTILFQNDWKLYKDAVIDYKTKNKSFLRMASLYREMKISNNAFMLSLLDPSLQGVDPYDPNLSMEQMAKIAIECKRNFWYFIREIARAPGIAGGNVVMLEANRGNMALYWLFFNHITLLLIQIRQTGKSFSSDVLMDYLLEIRCTNTQINLLTKDDTLRSANITRLKDISSELPFYLRQRNKGDVNNTEELTVRSLSNSYKAHVPQKSPKMALNLGRGLTSPIFQIDEGPFQSNIAISLPAALAAGTAARDSARRNGEPYGTILTTTAGKKDDRDGKFVFELLSNSAEWTEKLLDSPDTTVLENTIRKNSRSGELRVNCTFNHRQLGKTDAWLKQAIEDALVTGEAADRDFFNVWTSGTQSSPLPIAVLEKIRNSQMPPVYTEISPQYGYITKWYIEEHEIEYRLSNSKFVLGCDSSDASGGDDISLILTDIKNGEVVAAGNYNETNLITFAQWLCDWFINFEHITGIIERRSSGVAILDYLLLMLPAKGIDPFKRLFNMCVNNAEDDQERFREISVPLGRKRMDTFTIYKKTFGFATSGGGTTSRTELYSTTLQNAAKTVGDKIKDLTTINQITGLTTRNGRVDHQIGEHDDMCFIGSSLVRTINGNQQIKDLKVGDLVLTRKGYKPIVKLFCSEKEVITKYGITGTPNHPFITPNGEIEFKNLKLESVVYIWNEKLSCIEEKTIIDIQSLKENNIKTISIDMINGKNRQSRYIDKYMKTKLDQFFQNTVSIIKTAISIIIPLKILKCLHKQSILKDIQCLMKKKLEEALPEKLKTISLNGKKTILNLQNKYILKTVKKVQVEEKRTQIVYNLMVADCHEYFVNDILVHNCIAFLLCFWLVTQGKNLSFYGIDSKQILSEVKKKEIVDARSAYEYNEQQHIRKEIEDTYNQMNVEKDEFIIQNLEHKLRSLNRKLILEEGENFSIDELIDKLKKEKRNRINTQKAASNSGYYKNYGGGNSYGYYS